MRRHIRRQLVVKVRDPRVAMEVLRPKDGDILLVRGDGLDEYMISKLRQHLMHGPRIGIIGIGDDSDLEAEVRLLPKEERQRLLTLLRQ